MNDFCTWEINGLKFKLDMEDADTLERYLKALEHIESISDIDETSNTVTQIRKNCEAYRLFFIDTLGKDAERIFKDMPDNMRLYFDIFENFLTFIYKQKIAFASRILSINKKYVPGMREDTKNESTI